MNKGLVFSAFGTSIILVLVSTGRAQEIRDGLKIWQSPTTGLAAFVTAADGGIIEGPPADGAQVQAIDFLRAHGTLFGVQNADTQLRLLKIEGDSLGHTHTTFEQVHEGITVFSGILKIHQNAQNQFLGANGDFYPPAAKMDVDPGLSAEQAITIAAESIPQEAPQALQADLVIVDPGWYGDPPIGARLAYYIIMDNFPVGVSEAFFIDAHKGEILDRWSLLYHAKDREIHDTEGSGEIPGPLARSEGDPPTGDFDVDAAYDYYGDTYDYYFRAFGRDSIDDVGLTMLATVDYAPGGYCPNASWSSSLLQMFFCAGTVTDDVVGHELTHGVTQFTAGLIYQNQSGQLNESYSDIFGEMVDLFNGDAAFAGPPGGTPWPEHETGTGLDTPNNLRTDCSPEPDYVDGVRWLVGEDAIAFGGAIRDMWDPPCEGDPDNANSPLQTCPSGDNGGVHSGSGIPNHAFAMLVDGKIYNDITVTPIGPIKAGAVWYRALTTYLTVASDFEDAYVAFNLAAQDLVGTFPNDPRTGDPSTDVFTAADADEVDNALQAVEMNTEGACGATVDVLDSSTPPYCDSRSTIYFDDFENGPGDWSVTNDAPTPFNWVLVSDLPHQRPGTAWFIEDPSIGNCNDIDESGLHSLISPVIQLPAIVGRPTLAFTHYLETEKLWDGGNVAIRVNGGDWQVVPGRAFLFNSYNTTFMAAYQSDSTGPLAGQHAWSGAGGVWGTSLIALDGLAAEGDTVEVRFDFGKDGCTGVTGWWVDDVEIYDCPCGSAADCDDDRFCTLDACVNEFCTTAGETCGTASCLEATDSCVFGDAFHDDFEFGNSQGWDLYAPGSDASTGLWVTGIPNGTLSSGSPAQPSSSFTGRFAAFTDQNSSLGRDDVDGGISYLVSPVIDLSAADSAELSYIRWYFNGQLADVDGDFDDSYIVAVSDDDGNNWVDVEALDGTQSANEWTETAVILEDHIDLTANVRIRFGARDANGGDIIEGAVDDVIVRAFQACNNDTDCDDGDPCTEEFCNPSDLCDYSHSAAGSSCDDGDPCDGQATCDGLGGCIVAITDCNNNDVEDSCDIDGGTSDDLNGNGIPDECECIADIDGSGAVDIVDLLEVLAVWGVCPGCPADIDDSGDVGITDLLAVLANWGPC